MGRSLAWGIFVKYKYQFSGAISQIIAHVYSPLFTKPLEKYSAELI
jgi:hypothetical protein